MLPRQKVEPEEISVLLIEDSATDAAAVAKAILFGESWYDFKITTKETMAEGLLSLNTAPADVVLLDLNLPDAKNLKALDTLRRQFPNLPIVVLSGSADMDTIHKSLLHGAQEFLVKGECSGTVIRQSLYQAIVRKQVEQEYLRGDRL